MSTPETAAALEAKPAAPEAKPTAPEAKPAAPEAKPAAEAMPAPPEAKPAPTAKPPADDHIVAEAMPSKIAPKPQPKAAPPPKPKPKAGAKPPAPVAPAPPLPEPAPALPPPPQPASPHGAYPPFGIYAPGSPRPVAVDPRGYLHELAPGHRGVWDDYETTKREYRLEERRSSAWDRYFTSWDTVLEHGKTSALMPFGSHDPAPIHYAFRPEHVNDPGLRRHLLGGPDSYRSPTLPPPRCIGLAGTRRFRPAVNAQLQREPDLRITQSAVYHNPHGSSHVLETMRPAYPGHPMEACPTTYSPSYAHLRQGLHSMPSVLHEGPGRVVGTALAHAPPMYCGDTHVTMYPSVHHAAPAPPSPAAYWPGAAPYAAWLHA